MRLLIFRSERNPVVSPLRNSVHDRVKRGTLGGEPVLDADRHFGDNQAVHDAFRFKLLESLGQKSIVQSRDGITDIGEPNATTSHGAEDCSSPAFADQFHRLVERRTEGGNSLFVFHNAHSSGWIRHWQLLTSNLLDTSRILPYSKQHTEREGVPIVRIQTDEDREKNNGYLADRRFALQRRVFGQTHDDFEHQRSLQRRQWHHRI